MTPQEPPIIEDSYPYPALDEYDDPVYYRRYRKRDRVIWLIAIILEILIAFRVFLKLIAANPESGFASFVYGVTAPFLAPFTGLTSTPSINGSVLEFSSIIAMAVYALLFWIALYAIRLIWGR
ncbi:MAG: YggT family protein [Chloroflexota bacterium]